MTQQEKQLLLIDLYARLPYGVKMLHSEELPGWFSKECGYGKGTSTFIFTLTYDSLAYTITELDRVKPYLRTMSSMTEDEKDDLHDWGWVCEENNIYSDGSSDANGLYQNYQKDIQDVAWLINWLNAHHFDYRGLIEKGLALEAPEGMYKTE